jgi:hypothetical protein
MRTQTLGPLLLRKPFGSLVCRSMLISQSARSSRSARRDQWSTHEDYYLYVFVFLEYPGEMLTNRLVRPWRWKLCPGYLDCYQHCVSPQITSSTSANLTPSPPLTPTAVVPEGTVLDYQQYQTSVNRAVISAAVAADSRSNTTSGAGTRIRPVDAAFAGTAGWMAMAAGVVGMGWGVWAL